MPDRYEVVRRQERAAKIDTTWRLVHRGPAAGYPGVKAGEDCYLFRRGFAWSPVAIEMHVVPVATFWGSR